MPSLHAKFPAEWQQSHRDWLSLECILDGDPLDAPETHESLVVTIQSTIHNTPHSTVFRGVLHGPESSSSDSDPIVLKFAYKDETIRDLVAEADRYRNELRSLQGSVVPLFWGIFHGTWLDGRRVACIVLEDCGEPLSNRFVDRSVSDRLEILSRLLEVHRCGLRHGDFLEYNVLENNGEFIIIDFHGAEKHVCNCKMEFYPGEPAPDAADFGCSELEMLSDDFSIWIWKGDMFPCPPLCLSKKLNPSTPLHPVFEMLLKSKPPPSGPKHRS